MLDKQFFDMTYSVSKSAEVAENNMTCRAEIKRPDSSTARRLIYWQELHLTTL